MTQDAFDHVRKTLLDDMRKVTPRLEAAASGEAVLTGEVRKLAELFATVAAIRGPPQSEESLGDPQPLSGV